MPAVLPLISTLIAISLLAGPTRATDLTSGMDKVINPSCAASGTRCIFGPYDEVYGADYKLAVDDKGNAIAIWTTSSYPYRPPYTSFYNASTRNWSAPVAFTGDGATSPRVGFDAAGNAIAVWVSINSHGEEALQSSRYAAASRSWTVPVTVRPFVPGTLSALGDLAVSRNGDAVLAIDYTRGGGNLIRYDSATKTWADLPGSGGGGLQKIAIDPRGNVILGRITSGFDDPSVVRVSYYDAAARIWRHQEYDRHMDDGTTSIGTSGISVSIDRFGHAMVMWQKTTKTVRSDGTTSTVRQTRSARYLATKRAWMLKYFPYANNSSISRSVLSADQNANVTAAWVQWVGGYQKVLASRYSSQTGAWSRPVVIQRGSFHSRRPDIATDQFNNVVVSWSQRTDSGIASSSSAVFKTTVARFKWTAGSWAAPHTIQDTHRNSFGTDVEVDCYGRAIVLWSQVTGRTAGNKPLLELRTDRLLPQ